MRVLLLVLVLFTAGCTLPGATTDDVRAPPLLVAPDATLRIEGDTVFATWTGSLTPISRLPIPNPIGAPPADPTQPLANMAEHAFTLPTDVTFVRGWLNWTGEATVSLLLLNDTNRRMCGETFVGEAPAECFMTLFMPFAEPVEWKARASVERADGPIDYELTLGFSTRELPLLGYPVPYGADAPLRFGEPTLVDADRHTAEPSIAVTPEGTIYVAAPTGAQEALWRSDDGGKTFAFIPIHNTPTDPGSSYPIGGGDSDVALHGESTIYFADQQGGSGQTVSSSHDGGATWFTTPLGAGPPMIPGGLPLAPPVPMPVPNPGVPTGAVYRADRQWLVTDGDLVAWMGFNSAQGATVVKTLDGGRTWPVRAFVEGDFCFRGNLARAPDGTLYLAGCNEDGPGVGVSTDGGLSFTYKQVAARGGETDTSFFFAAHLFVVATTDSDGNVYVVWSDEAQRPEDTKLPAECTEATPCGLNVWMASSSDQGETWSKPKRVNAASGTYVQPWATAGEPGKLAVVSYATKFVGNPERVMGEWYPVVAYTEDALADAPVWQEASMTAGPVQYGPICMRGSACGGARNLLDFFQVQADSGGLLHVAYVDGRAGISARLSNIMYVGQTEGPTLGAKSADKNARA